MARSRNRNRQGAISTEDIIGALLSGSGPVKSRASRRSAETTGREQVGIESADGGDSGGFLDALKGLIGGGDADAAPTIDPGATASEPQQIELEVTDPSGGKLKAKGPDVPTEGGGFSSILRSIIGSRQSADQVEANPQGQQLVGGGGIIGNLFPGLKAKNEDLAFLPSAMQNLAAFAPREAVQNFGDFQALGGNTPLQQKDIGNLAVGALNATKQDQLMQMLAAQQGIDIGGGADAQAIQTQSLGILKDLLSKRTKGQGVAGGTGVKGGAESSKSRVKQAASLLDELEKEGFI
jgi:hypothetical protein